MKPLVMYDSAVGERVTIIICDGCHTECSTCRYRFYCYTTGTMFGTNEEIASAIKELYAVPGKDYAGISQLLVDRVKGGRNSYG